MRATVAVVASVRDAAEDAVAGAVVDAGATVAAAAGQWTKEPDSPWPISRLLVPESLKAQGIAFVPNSQGIP